MNAISVKDKVFPKKRKESFDKSSIVWFPIILVLLLLPNVVICKIFISKFSDYDWYKMNSQTSDLFLYGKQSFLTFIACVMLIVLVAYFLRNSKSIYLNGKKWRILIPLCIYITFVFISSLCSEYRYIALSGSDDQFESLFAVFGYFLCVPYICLFLRKENDIKLIRRLVLLCAAFIAGLAILQLNGIDPNSMEWFTRMITPKWYTEAGGTLSASFSKGTVLLFSYNPNYAGVFLSMMSSFVLLLLLTERNKKAIILKLILLVALVTGLIGTGSKAGLLVFAGVAVLALLYLSKMVFHYWYLTIPAITMVIMTLSLIIQAKELNIINNIKYALQITKTEENPLQSMRTEPDGVHITYKDVSFVVKMDITEETIDLQVVEEKTKSNLGLIPSEDNTYYTLDEPALDDVRIELGVINEAVPAFLITLNDQEWKFVKMENTENIYYFLNNYLKLEILTDTERIGFKGYERFATGRGLIWSMTLPVVKDHIILGSGANTFAHVYPQNNYKDLLYYANSATITTRPHCMYLQIAVESGVVSLIALLTFFAWYLLQSIGLYWKSNFETGAEKTGVACMFAVLAYLVCALTNDSMIAVAPVFWCIIGLGVAVNQYVKHEIKTLNEKND